MAYAMGDFLTAQLLNALLSDHAQSASIANTETYASTAYGDLPLGAGPTVTLTSAGTKALLVITANMFTNSAVFVGHYASVAVSGATTIAASDAISLRDTSNNAGAGFRMSVVEVITINPGPNTFTMKYRCATATASSFATRKLFVLAP